MTLEPTPSPIIRLHPSDDVAIARQQLIHGMPLGPNASVRGLIPAGHKVALRDIAAGEPVRRYWQIIGGATTAIPAGEHVHTHNLALGNFQREYDFAVDTVPAPAAT